MKVLFVFLFIVSFILVGCNTHLETETENEIGEELFVEENEGAEIEIGQISVLQLAEMMEQSAINEDEIIYIDVREVHEFEEAHIEGMLNYPMSTFNQSYTELPKDQEIVIICRSGNRSMQVADFLIEQGYEKVTNVHGAMLEWEGPVISN